MIKSEGSSSSGLFAKMLSRLKIALATAGLIPNSQFVLGRKDVGQPSQRLDHIYRSSMNKKIQRKLRSGKMRSRAGHPEIRATLGRYDEPGIQSNQHDLDLHASRFDNRLPRLYHNFCERISVYSVQIPCSFAGWHLRFGHFC